MNRAVAAATGLLLFPLCLPGQDSVAASTPPQGATGLPTDMILVKGGKVTLGTGADQMSDLTKAFQPKAPRARQKLLQKLSSELGTYQVDVQDFYLHRFLVTNEQYLQFVQAAKPKVRFPFHWWKFGAKEDHAAKAEEYRNAFKDQEKSDLLYWETYWDKLPYAIPKGEEQHPVVFVSWLDAQAFAGWAGMRLPSEAEWVWAATQGQARQFPWGDAWSEELLRKLRLYTTSEKKLKPVGTLGEVTRGPFGHEDIIGSVWQWTNDGYFPFTEDTYKKEIDKARKFKWLEGSLTEPEWNGAKRVLKGGSYFSWQNPDEFRLGTRAHMSRTQTVEGAGLRIAKSRVPGRDMCRSRMAVEYDLSVLGDRLPNYDDQGGVERYDLSPDGRLILNYHALAMVPLNHMGLDKNANADSLNETSRERTLVVGTLVTTETLQQPKLNPGIYTVCYRHKGLPKELTDALREATRELAQATKEKAADGKGKKADDKDEKKADDKKADEKKADDKKQKADWRKVLAKYGLTEEDVKAKDKFVRLNPGNLQVSAEENMLVFRAANGDYAGAMPTPQDIHIGPPHATEVTQGTAENMETWTFKVSAQWDAKTKGRGLSFTVPLRLSSAPDLSKPWRKPEGAKNQGPAPTQSRNESVAPSGDPVNKSK